MGDGCGWVGTACRHAGVIGGHSPRGRTSASAADDDGGVCRLAVSSAAPSASETRPAGTKDCGHQHHHYTGTKGARPEHTRRQRRTWRGSRIDGAFGACNLTRTPKK